MEGPSIRRTRALAVAALLAMACDASAPTPPAPGAGVNGQPIAVESAPTASTTAPSAAGKDVELAIVRRLAAEEAVRRGLAKDDPAKPRSVQDEERLRNALFAEMRDSLVLGEDELRAHYEKTTLRYATRQLVLRRQPFASEAEARAEDRRLGAEGRIVGQDAETLGPAPVDRLPPSVMPEALAFSAPGQRAAVMRDGRWSLVELEEVREAEPLAFELARPRVEQSLRLIRAQSEFSAEVDRLRREAERNTSVTEGTR